LSSFCARFYLDDRGIEVRQACILSTKKREFASMISFNRIQILDWVCRRNLIRFIDPWL